MITEDGEHVPPIDGDQPCDAYEESGPGAGLEHDAMPQCAACGFPWSAHSEEAKEEWREELGRGP